MNNKFKIIVIDNDMNVCNLVKCSCINQIIEDIENNAENRLIQCDNKVELLQEIECYMKGE